MIDRPSARHAYVKAEVATALAHQIRALRLQRGLTQAQLAKKLNTSANVISRLEDPSYGKISMSTLLDLSRVFDVGLSVKFMSLIDMVRETYIPNVATRYVETFESESQGLAFVSDVAPTSTPVALMPLAAPSALTSGIATLDPTGYRIVK